VNEARRLAYLDALEIETFVSRADLPGAAVSRRVLVHPPARPATAPATDIEPPAVAAEQPAADLRRQLAAGQPRPARPVERAPVPADSQPGDLSEEVPVFSVAMVIAGGCAWLEELPRGHELPDGYLALLVAISRALGWQGAEPALERFDWPMNNSSAMPQDGNAAGDAFKGFLMRCMAHHEPRRVVLLGEFDPGWFDSAELDSALPVNGPLAHTVSGRRMLREPGSKARAWADLRPLRTADA
jgi:hypothetical protein